MKRNKTCIKCKETKSLKEFYKTTIYKWQTDGHDYYCKSCRVGIALKSHRGGVRKKKCSIEDCERIHYAKTYCRNHYTRMFRNGTTELLVGSRSKHKKYNPEYQRKIHLMKKYKLTPEKYEEMAKDGCHICGKQALPHKYLHVDHDHNCCVVKYDKKGRSGYFKTCGLCVRGILCDSCNQAVGQYERDKMRDDYPLKNEVMMYVAKHNWLISDRMLHHGKKSKEQGNRKG
jgi:hypothetical protein